MLKGAFLYAFQHYCDVIKSWTASKLFPQNHPFKTHSVHCAILVWEYRHFLADMEIRTLVIEMGKMLQMG